MISLKSLVQLNIPFAASVLSNVGVLFSLSPPHPQPFIPSLLAHYGTKAKNVSHVDLII